ncbi:MAG: cobyrinate a,c-diamide synthase [Syntrophales bacterium]
MIDCPRIVIGGTGSGAGKTSLALGLVAALRRRGSRVQAFKVGPDFLDPSYLSIASGRPCYNLDGWMMGRDYVEKLVARVTADVDIAVIEGVMGLFDGAGHDSLEGSTAEIAAWLRAPVLLVADVYGMARSLAAVVKGFATFERKVRVAGIIANRCGSVRHGIMLAETLRASRLPPLVAAVPRGALPALPERRLGLVTADSRNLTPQALDELAGVFEHYSTLGEIVHMARSAPLLYVEADRRAGQPAGVRLGVARDAAFHFYYRDVLDALEDGGCALVPFSPVADKTIPEGLDALYLGGGYPEELAAELAANGPMLASVRDFAASGRPIYAEGGGLMYLCREMETVDGRRHLMAGVLPAATKVHRALQALAYVDVTLKEDSLWGLAGESVRGHEFRHSALAANPSGVDGWRCVYSMSRSRTDSPVEEGFCKGNILASYAHLHLAARPKALARFIASCGRPGKTKAAGRPDGGEAGDCRCGAKTFRK